MKKMLRYVAAVIAFCFLFLLCGKFFRYILVDDTSSYTRITFHEMYEQDNIDILFVGSSHCYRTFIPEILDKKLGVNTFNVGTSAQQMDGSFMVIKEAAKYNNIKHIYLEVYYNLAFNAKEDRNLMTQTYIISDYLRPSLDKMIYLLNASSKEHYINSFIPARRNWAKFFNADYVKNLIDKKLTRDYKKYEYTYVTGDTERYAGKGYVENKTAIEKWNFFSESGWTKIDINNISSDWLQSLKDIIEFCNKKEIELTLVSAPMPCFNLVASENYDEYIAFIQNFISNSNVDYFDFNLCKEEFFPNDSTLFYDISHVNCYGAEKFSNLFADLVNGNISKNELFWDSYADKVDNMEAAVFGISYCNANNEDGGCVKHCKIISSCRDDLEYKIIIKTDEGKTKLIQDYAENKYFNILCDGHGILNILYRSKESPNKTNLIEIAY
ncbi:MAG: hypothetical protein HFJ07_00015 [Lachnospiraceae bacterium]|nr:hypothetical protein [Lachnospiraceae bacterium]